MSTERLRELEDLFHQLVDLEPGMQRNELEQLAHRDAELAAELRELLRSDAPSTTPELQSPLFEDGDHLPPGRIGPYDLIRELGRGGMGRVWLAQQDRPLQRKVALKVVANVADDPQLTVRFEAERQALALMTHPAIARVHDAGRTDDGQLWFAMEYVAGRPLAEHCQEHRLSLRGRVQLMIEVCEAVQHAHQRGVVHRDLKGANILVHRDENDRDTPKVIDFGVAKAVDVPLTAETLRTQEGLLLGTPEYMAPEQTDASLGGADTRSDVWSLGVILYELVIGERPFERKGKTSVATLELLRDVREQPTVAPTTRFARSPRREAVARERRLDSPTLQRELGRGLEAVILKCLEKNPDRRYPSPRALAEDLARWARREPVEASMPGRWDRWRATARRHWLPLTAVAAVLVALSGGLAIAAGQWMRAESNAAAAGRNLDDYRRMRDVQRLQEHVDAAFWDLWPAWPEREADLRRWVVDVEALRSEQSELERRVGELEIEIENAAEADVDERQWQLETLRLLLRGVEALAEEGPTTNALSNVRQRLERCERVRSAMRDHADDWNEAIEAIADRSACPRYDGLQLPGPQTALVPLGRDPDSGLWEFWDMQSGERPERGEDGRWEMMPATGVLFVLIPGGTFRMGAATDDPEFPDPGARPDERPVHEVDLEPYFLSRYELTQAQWHRLVGDQPSRYAVGHQNQERVIQWFHPVESVSWADARVNLTRFAWRLPTEAEWERACRGGTDSPLWFAKDYATDPTQWAAIGPHGALSQKAFEWVFEWATLEGRMIHFPIGQRAPNPFGLHDMTGNVAEWCQDRYLPYDKEVMGPHAERAMESEGGFRVVRGGHYLSTGQQCRSAARTYAAFDYAHPTVGLRPARSILQPGEIPARFRPQRDLSVPSHWDFGVDANRRTLGVDR